MMTESDYKQIGLRIRKAREEKGLTQEKLSELCSLSAAHIGNIERGTRIPSLDAVHTISCELSVSMDELMFDAHPSADLSLANILSILQTKDKEKVKPFMSVLRVLVNHLDEL